jgi:NADH-quinone oxidoreductase subunit N
MIAMHNTEKSLEAAIKYFTMGAVSASFFAMGSLIMYYVTGSIELGVMSEYLIQNSFEPYGVLLIGVVFMLAALGFKLSLVPFHSWVPDVYEGSNTGLAGYIAIVPKIAALVVAIRFFQIFVEVDNPWIHTILYGIAVITMTLPNIIALVQSDVKRMLAYSSISHAGFVLVAIMIGSSQALEALFLYWILFAFVIFGVFSMLWIHSTKEKSSFYGFNSDYDFRKFTGLVKTSPLSAFLLAIFMFGLAGIPPFSLFFGKMYLLLATIQADEIALAVIMVVNSAIAAFYYLKLIVVMFLKEKDENAIVIVYKDMSSTIVTVIIALSAILTVTSIFWIEPLLGIITHALQSSGY